MGRTAGDGRVEWRGGTAAEREEASGFGGSVRRGGPLRIENAPFGGGGGGSSAPLKRCGGGGGGGGWQGPRGDGIWNLESG